MIDLEIEKKIKKEGFNTIGGIDEAGRGPLAGPVVAACVTINKSFDYKNSDLELIQDSKKLSPKKREYLFEIIKNLFPEIGIGVCDAKTIDKINILQATFLAMKKAIGSLNDKPDYIIVDGNFSIPSISITQKPIIKGDSKALSIAAASIIAKVTRDRIMDKHHEDYPYFNFDKNKGYGTKTHIENLIKYGPCPIHRLTFQPIPSLKKIN